MAFSEIKMQHFLAIIPISSAARNLSFREASEEARTPEKDFSLSVEMTEKERNAFRLPSPFDAAQGQLCEKIFAPPLSSPAMRGRMKVGEDTLAGLRQIIVCRDL